MSGNSNDKTQMLLEIQKFGLSFMVATIPKGSGRVQIAHIPMKDVVNMVSNAITPKAQEASATAVPEVVNGEPKVPEDSNSAG